MKYDDVASALRDRFAFRELTLPSTDTRIAVRLLRDEELDGARRRAIARCERDKVNLALDPDFFERVLQREIVALAFFDVETIAGEKPEVFFSSEQIVAECDPSIIRMLFGYYKEHEQAADPLLFLDEDTAREVADTLGKSPNAKEMLSTYDAHTLLSLVLSMAALLRKSPSPS